MSPSGASTRSVWPSVHGSDVQRETAFHEFVEQPRQGDLRYVEQHVDVLRESGPAAQGRREAADESVADATGREDFALHFDRSHQVARQGLRSVWHGGQ